MLFTLLVDSTWSPEAWIAFMLKICEFLMFYCSVGFEHNNEKLSYHVVFIIGIFLSSSFLLSPNDGSPHLKIYGINDKVVVNFTFLTDFLSLFLNYFSLCSHRQLLSMVGQRRYHVQKSSPFLQQILMGEPRYVLNGY